MGSSEAFFRLVRDKIEAEAAEEKASSLIWTESARKKHAAELSALAARYSSEEARILENLKRHFAILEASRIGEEKLHFLSRALKTAEDVTKAQLLLRLGSARYDSFLERALVRCLPESGAITVSCLTEDRKKIACAVKKLRPECSAAFLDLRETRPECASCGGFTLRIEAESLTYDNTVLTRVRNCFSHQAEQILSLAERLFHV
ncbi:MAG: hypothetical protein PHQ23_01120 [Candidatus Wallbacteria bacterium]|nr:hypothetical protein [Candidatus Wallbacteria bacterium]